MIFWALVFVHVPLTRSVSTVLKCGLTPSASGSAYLELEPSNSTTTTLNSSQLQRPSLKLICTVHGPKPLPRSTPYTHQLLLSARVKFAPFASSRRRTYIPDPGERNLAIHLETALRGALIGERWPKSGVDVVVTVLEGDEGRSGRNEGLGAMTILAGCITVASAALADAGVDCVDIVTGGVAGISSDHVVLDPCSAEHEDMRAVCVVGYLQSRDEITELWSRGKGGASESVLEPLVDNAIEAAKAARLVLLQALDESVEQKAQLSALDPSKT